MSAPVPATPWRPDQAGSDTARALYLPTQPDATFAMLHTPDADSRGSTGVVMCPPFGWDEVCTHRVRRAWAASFALAGHPALRIDLPGTGDSAGSVHDAGRIDAWTASVAGAATWLRDELGCARVVGLGIGLGGMLAWRAAAQGAAIDDLILWATPLGGRRLIRELRGAAMLSIDPRLAFESKADADRYDTTDPGGLLDESGQALTRETIDALSALDLTALSLPEPAARRILLLKRSDAQGDSDLEQHLQTAGAAVTIADGDSYGAMMRYIQDAVVPDAVIARSVAWVTDRARAGNGCAALAAAVPPPGAIAAQDSLELSCDGIRIRETPFTVHLSSGPVRCIISEPAGGTTEQVCALFLGGGVDRRIGPNRAWVETSRRWASRGIAAVRFDLSGIGDSAGDERQWATLSDQYGQIHVEHTVELLDRLSDRGLPPRFMLVGFCSGGYRSLHTALVDSRVTGVFCIGLPFLRWSWWTVNVRDSWIPLWQPRPGDSPSKIRVARFLQHAIKVIHRAGHATLRVRAAWPGRADRVARKLSRRGTEVVLMLKSQSHAFEELSTPRRQERLGRLPHFSVRRLPGDDLRFRPVATQQWVAGTLDDGLARVLAVHAVTASTPSTAAGLTRESTGPLLSVAQRNGSPIGYVSASSK
jgi:pimeloyl-ACP methyl ester carboxylesterase